MAMTKKLLPETSRGDLHPLLTPMITPLRSTRIMAPTDRTLMKGEKRNPHRLKPEWK
jgi:hypothetical protein